MQCLFIIVVIIYRKSDKKLQLVKDKRNYNVGTCFSISIEEIIKLNN